MTTATAMTQTTTTTVSYTNLWTGKVQRYNPATEGFYSVVLKEGWDGRLSDGRRFQFGMGAVDAPQGSLAQAQRRLCGTICQHPEVANRVEIVKVPCVMSNREAWVPVTDQPDPAIMEEARKVRWDSSILRDAFYRGCTKIFM